MRDAPFRESASDHRHPDGKCMYCDRCDRYREALEQVRDECEDERHGLPACGLCPSCIARSALEGK